jgi:integrase
MQRRWFSSYANNENGLLSAVVITRPLMTVSSPSRMNLADLIPMIEQANLSPIQKRDQISAVRTVSRLLRSAPEDIEVDPAKLRRRLETIAPAAAGLSRGRWNNIRSLFGKALTLARPMLPGRTIAPLLPEWEQLLARLSRNRATSMLALARHLSMRGVPPNQVTLANLEAYRDAIHNDRLRAMPEQTWDTIVWTWNASRREMPGWPDIEIPRVIRREVYVLPWSNFPASLKADVDAFLLRLSGEDLSEHGPARPARPATLKTREKQLRVAASALVHKCVDPESIPSLTEIVTLEHFKLVLRFLLDRHNGQTSPQVAQIAAFLKGVARHWVNVDDLTLLQMQKVASRLSTGRKGLTAKNRERLRPFDDPGTVAQFLGLPMRIRREVEKDPRGPRRKAVEAQMAAAIAILLVVPLRIGNLAMLDLRKNLIARGKRVYLVVPENATKNKEPVDFELPPETVEVVAWYVRDYRPHLVRAPTDALFPGEGSGPKSAEGLGAQIKAAVFQFTGLEFNPHLFRHAGAKIFLDQRPGQYEIVRQVLRHRSIETTTSFYAGAETRKAGQHYASVINKLREELNQTRAAPRQGAGRSRAAKTKGDPA